MSSFWSFEPERKKWLKSQRTVIKGIGKKGIKKKKRIKKKKIRKKK